MSSTISEEISRPVVFLPGTVCDERVWFQCWRHMHVRDRRFVPLQWAESIEQMLQLTEDRVNYSTDKVHLAGFSMGGYVASLYALQHPEKVASLTLLGYCSSGLSELETKQRKLLLVAIEKRNYNGLGTEGLKRYLHASQLGNSAITELIQDMNNDLGTAVLAAQVKATTPRQDLTSQLASLNVPLNIIAADEDLVAPLSQLKQMQQDIAGSHLHILEQSGHMFPIEKPAEVASLLSTCLHQAG